LLPSEWALQERQFMRDRSGATPRWSA